MSVEDTATMHPMTRLSRDLAAAATTMSEDEARFLVDSYYQMQENRKRSNNQVRSMEAEPHSILVWLADQSSILEDQIKRALDKYSDGKMIGQWAKSIYGIGPVITAGMMAHIDINKAPTAGHIWSFAGLTQESIWIGGKEAEASVRAFVDEDNKIGPDQIIEIATKLGGSPKWLSRRIVRAATEKDIPFLGLDRMEDLPYVKAITEGVDMRMKHAILALSKRPWNASLKTLCWKVGQSFMKFSNDEDCYYGHLYRQRKAYEVERNVSGNANIAAAILKKKKIGKTTDAYRHLSEGHLPPAQIDARARRYAVKLFLAHMQTVWWFIEKGELPVKPYVVSHLEHTHLLSPPNMDLVPGLAEAWRKRN